MNENSPKKFFSVVVVHSDGFSTHRLPNGVYLNVFNLDGPEPHPDDSEQILSNICFGANEPFNIAKAIQYAMKLGAVPYTEEAAAEHFWESENNSDPEVGTEFIF